MVRVYPKLKEYCQSKGYDFQVVDMRWGVRDEATADHMTSELCMRELRACQKLSTGPNFIVSFWSVPCLWHNTKYRRQSIKRKSDKEQNFNTLRKSIQLWSFLWEVFLSVAFDNWSGWPLFRLASVVHKSIKLYQKIT